MHPLSRLLAVFAALLSLNACAPVDIRESLANQRPTVSVADQRLTRLDFERVNMAFGIQVDNPNPIALTLAGLDYELKLAGHSFASGKQGKQMRLAASGASRFELPLSMAFKEIYASINQLKGKSQIPYELTTGLIIDVPLLGKLRYPVTTKGVLPLPRLPKISLISLSLLRLNYSRADLALKLEVENPNSFSVGLDRLNYDFTVNGKRWLSGHKTALGDLKRGEKSEIILPLTLNFMEMGSSIYGLLQQKKDLNYRLNGKLDASSGHSLIGNFDMPFANSGKVRLAK